MLVGCVEVTRAASLTVEICLCDHSVWRRCWPGSFGQDYSRGPPGMIPAHAKSLVASLPVDFRKDRTAFLRSCATLAGTSPTARFTASVPKLCSPIAARWDRRGGQG